MRRSFWKYNLDNIWGLVAMGFCIVLGTFSFWMGEPGGLVAGWFFMLVALIVVVASFIDYKKHG